MRVVLAGSSGLIGTALRRSLEADGEDVVRLVRRAPGAPNEVGWDPRAPGATAGSNPLEGADAVINLAGAPLDGQRWTRRYQGVLLRSRIEAASALATMACTARRPPRLLLSASGIRWYGVDRGDQPLRESTPPASPGFLPGVARAWEAATEPASNAGIAVCHLRLGLVLSTSGGFLPPLLSLFRLGLGGCVGPPGAFWSFISLTDCVRAIRFLAEGRPPGPYNISAPQPVPSVAFARALAGATGRPGRLRIPAWAVAVARGGPATEVLGSLRVLPVRLEEAGFQFQHPDIEAALGHALATAEGRPP